MDAIKREVHNMVEILEARPPTPLNAHRERLLEDLFVLQEILREPDLNTLLYTLMNKSTVNAESIIRLSKADGQQQLLRSLSIILHHILIMIKQ